MEYKILNSSEFESLIRPFCDLYRKCFSGPINEENVRWRYLDNPFGDLIMCVALDQGRLVANYSASPCELVCRGKAHKAALSLNTMTDPAYEGRGLFTTLCKKLTADIELRSYMLIMGFPNYLSNYIFVSKQNWTTLYELPTLELNLLNFNRNLMDTATVGDDDGFLFAYDSCRNENRAVYINKTSAYLRWRYYLNPSNQYKNFVLTDHGGKVRSRLICKEYEEKLNIVDYCFAGNEDAELLLNRAIEYAQALHKERITVWSQLGTPDHLMFERYRFKNNYPITYFGLKVFQRDVSNDFIHDFRNWSLHAGDDNVY